MGLYSFLFSTCIALIIGKKSENVTVEMSDLYIWKTNLFNTSIGDFIMSLKTYKIDGRFHFLLKEMIYLKDG